MKTLHINIYTKKDECVLTHWEVSMDRPYPDIEGGHSLRWRNADGLLPSYGRPATLLEPNYTAYLLKLDFDINEATGDRRDYAGYDGNGSVIYRGRSLGEVRCEVRGGWVTFSNAYGDPDLTPSAKQMLDEQVKPALMDFIERERAALKAEAVASLRKGVTEQIETARQQLTALWADMDIALMKEEA